MDVSCFAGKHTNLVQFTLRMYIKNTVTHYFISFILATVRTHLTDFKSGVGGGGGDVEGAPGNFTAWKRSEDLIMSRLEHTC